MRIRYFFTNKRDNTPNNFIWHDAPRPLRISDVKRKLKDLGIINNQSHLRFLDKIKGEKVWLDIINEEVECPLNNEGLVDIKILQQFYEASQGFLEDVFRGIPEDSYEIAVTRLRQILLNDIISNKNQTKKMKDKNKSDNTANESGYVAFQNQDEFENSENLSEKLENLDITDKGKKIFY